MCDSDKKTNEVKSFWNSNPCGSNFIIYSKGIDFYKKYDEYRYKTESHILNELDLIGFDKKKVLEIGLGQGADSMQIVKRGAMYYGIDLTEESVYRVKERFDFFNCEYKEIIQADARKIPFLDNTFDVVYSHGVIHHSPDIYKISKEIFRVLKPHGIAVVMLYHKNSFNYYISIGLIRRIGLVFLYLFPIMSSFVSKLTGESSERILKHRENLKTFGFKYLKMDNFIHKSTDGPENVYSSVWTKKTAKNLFKDFKSINTKVHFFNERHLMGFQKILPRKFMQNLSLKFGWHLWIYAKKN